MTDATTTIIDTDVHEFMTTTEDLVPHLPREWRPYITGSALKFPLVMGGMFPYAHTVGSRLDWSDDDGVAGTTVDALRRHLFDEEGESLAILNGFFHISAQTGQIELAQALASAYNDWQIEHWLDRDDRIRGSIHVHAHDPDQAVREIDRVAAHPKVVQVFLPMSTERQYGDAMYHSIYEAAVRHGLVVALHHGPQTKTGLGYPRYFAEWHTLAAPLAAMNQLTSLVFNGVFDRFPTLRVVLLEAGIGWLPWLMRRLDENLRELRSETPWVKRLPSEHIRDNVRMSTQPMADTSPADFRRIVEEVQSEEVFLFSSDYPHYDGDRAGVAFPPSLGAGLRERVFFRNALATYPRLDGGLP